MCFYSSCKLSLRQFAWNMKSCFLGQISKDIIVVVCWISQESGKGCSAKKTCCRRHLQILWNFAWNVKSSRYSGKNKKISSSCRMLSKPREWWRLKRQANLLQMTFSDSFFFFFFFFRDNKCQASFALKNYNKTIRMSPAALRIISSLKIQSLESCITYCLLHRNVQNLHVLTRVRL